MSSTKRYYYFLLSHSLKQSFHPLIRLPYRFNNAMPPQESTALLVSSRDEEDDNNNRMEPSSTCGSFLSQKKTWWAKGALVVATGILAFVAVERWSHKKKQTVAWTKATGPYKIVQAHEGKHFFDGFTFYKGDDSLGSAGYLTYKDAKDSFRQNLANVTTETVKDPFDPSAAATEHDFVYMSSQPTQEGPRDSVRLEGKTRYDRGLFILDLRHLPTGCGVWPAFWLTDEDVWPDHGEIDVRTLSVQMHLLQ